MLTPFNISLATDDLSVRFLQLVLPKQGYYIAAVKLAKRRGFKPNIFAATIEELWAAIENADRDGFEAYHACASFKEPHNDPPGKPDGQKQFGRTKNNALVAKAFGSILMSVLANRTPANRKRSTHWQTFAEH